MPPLGSGFYPAAAPIEPSEPLPVLVAFPERTKQRRWTVLIRTILAIPLAIVVLVMGIGAFFVVIVGWFGALFTGRLPNFARTYIVRYLKLTVNLSTYTYLLTDTFPPFEAEGPGYSVHMAVPTATRLSRWAVFFRLILVIPAAIVATVVGYGIGILAFFLWLITLVSGWLPLSAHNAISALIRYQTRLNAYYYLVVPTYPNGLFGDGNARTVPEVNLPATSPQATEATASFDAPETVPLVGTEPVAFDSPGFASVQQVSWRLFLNRGARRLLVIAIILGALGYVGQITLQAVATTHHDDQVSTLNSSVASLNSSFRRYEQSVQNCPKDASQVACVEEEAAMLSSQLRTFADTVNGLSVNGLPSNAIASAVSSARTNASDFEKLAKAGPTATDYQNVARNLDLRGDLDQLQGDLNRL
jgi:hypothetical protein